MTVRRVVLSLVLASCSTLIFVSAHAYIGGVGSPVTYSTPPSPAAAPPAPPPSSHPPAENESDNKANTGERTPLLVIRFNHHHTYFQDALRQAVEATNKAKPGAFYDVVSKVPASGNYQQSNRINANAAANLNAVVYDLKRLGVLPSQIHTSTEPSSTEVTQEVDIFVE